MTTEQHLSSVRLRAMEPEDLETLYRIENDMQLWGLGATNVPYSRYALHEFMANTTGDIYTDKQVRLMIENEEQELVGMVDVINFDPRHLRAEIGLIIERPYRRHGYAEKALEAVVDYASQVLHLHQLYAYVSADNEPSLCLFGKMGFSTGARLKDWLFDGGCYHDALLVQRFF